MKFFARNYDITPVFHQNIINMPSFSIFHTHNNTIDLGAHRSYHQQRRYCLDNSIFQIPVTKLYPILQWEELIC